MPEKRLDRMRKGYEDYVFEPPQAEPAVVVTDNGFTANVIEGDHFISDADRAAVIEGAVAGADTPWGV